MRFDELKKQTGIYVGLKLSTTSAEELEEWVKKNNIPNPVPKDDYHVTLVYDRNHSLDDYTIEEFDPIKLDPSTYSFELFGQEKNVLVLAFKNKQLEDKHAWTRQELGFNWDFPSYIPHITLALDVPNFNVSKLSLPDFPIYLVEEYKESLDEDWNGNKS